MPRQKRDVFAAITQRRDQDRDDAEAIIEVFAKSAFGNLFFKIFVCGCNDADIYIRFFGAADGTNFAFLKDAIQLHLHGEAHVADFVHEERAAMSGLEEALAVFVSSGECSLHVTEELRLQEGLRERTTVNGDKRGLRTAAVFMDGPGDQFFTVS